MPKIVAKFAVTLALVAVPAVGVAAVTTHSASSGTSVGIVADEAATTPTPTASKDTTGWQ
ncbi:hypothetical protein HLK59_46140 [Streptomyces sp. S3(2020)]|uniref:hypothetical protein n=1 Tax=Streptomyces sp. S3(2020) TaxID=2732044 RepID=UPI0014896C24|nr:hypothetical protein [Streptomyces sp. S3(2020)]NNN37585.1 hypothetical protein [Streptomyces sp. S3(2020)]